jgi:hypothetical protein
MTLRYAHLAPSHTQNAVNLLDEVIGAHRKQLYKNYTISNRRKKMVTQRMVINLLNNKMVPEVGIEPT